ncbi:MAG TPA: inorganic diphosphatase [Longimicrobiales bacterium]|nr:inorganic diphosphatase [Longimicrobiales bacterium]
MNEPRAFEAPVDGATGLYRVPVFVQNEAGKNIKNYHDEKTLEFLHSKAVLHPYPYPYGFIIGTDGHDGCNVDCFILTDRPLATGTIVECEVIGLMEQYEDGVEDYNILARLPDEAVEVTPEAIEKLHHHILAVYRGVAGKHMAVGEVFGVEAAVAYIQAHLERPSG